MHGLLKITLSHIGKIFALANYVQLLPFSTSTAREIVFKQLKFRKHFTLEMLDQMEYIQMNVYVKCAFGAPGNTTCISELKLVILDNTQEKSEEFCINALVHNDYNTVYYQGIADTFHQWEKQIEIIWENLPYSGISKKDYNFACMYNKGINPTINKKSNYTIDLSKVKEEIDYCYFFSVEFLGARSYFGHSLFTFDDCLLTAYKNQGYFDDCKVIFMNKPEVTNAKLSKLFEEVKTILVKFHFSIEEQY